MRFEFARQVERKSINILYTYIRCTWASLEIRKIAVPDQSLSAGHRVHVYTLLALINALIYRRTYKILHARLIDGAAV